MTTLLFGALWVNLAQCVLLTGAFSLLLLAGRPPTDFMRQWERRVLSWARWLVVVALEARAIWHAMLDTRSGFIWMVRHGLLIVLAAFLFLGGDVTARQNWIAARGEALLLAALALVLLGSSGHLAATSESP